MTIDNGCWNPTPNNTTRSIRPRTARPNGEEIWRLERQGRVASCELRDDRAIGAGFEVAIRHDGELILGRRCMSEDEGRYVSNAFRQDYASGG